MEVRGGMKGISDKVHNEADILERQRARREARLGVILGALGIMGSVGSTLYTTSQANTLRTFQDIQSKADVLGCTASQLWVVNEGPARGDRAELRAKLDVDFSSLERAHAGLTKRTRTAFENFKEKFELNGQGKWTWDKGSSENEARGCARSLQMALAQEIAEFRP